MDYHTEGNSTPFIIIILFVIIVSLFIVIPISVTNDYVTKEQSTEKTTEQSTIEKINGLKSPVILKSIGTKDYKTYITVLDGDGNIHYIEPSNVTHSIANSLKPNDTIR